VTDFCGLGPVWVWVESNLNPRSNEGPAWGLLQVIEVVRTDYNERHGTSYRRADLLDPVVNVTTGSTSTN